MFFSIRLYLNPGKKNYLKAYKQDIYESNEYLAESHKTRGIDAVALPPRRILESSEVLYPTGEKYLLTDLSKALEIFNICLEIDPLHFRSLKGYASVKIK